MVAILRPFPVAVEDLCELIRVPPVDELRPCFCPLCGEPSRRPGKPLGIVGHGSYTRQVLGHAFSAGKAIDIHVRRYLCRGCQATMSVLPDVLLPRRWYVAATILLALTLSLLRGETATDVRRQLGQRGDTPGWKTLDRWQRQLLAPLWSWMAAQLGFAERRPGCDRIQRSERLRRLLASQGAEPRSPTEKLEVVACALATGTAHTRDASWEIRRGQ